MADYNLVVLVGRLTRDPELKYIQQSGTPVARFTLAINRVVNLPDGNQQKSVAFIDVSVWRHQAELVSQYLRKGSPCLVSGHLEQSRWTDSSNQKRSKIRVRAERIQFLGRAAPETAAVGAAKEPDEPSEGQDSDGGE